MHIDIDEVTEIWFPITSYRNTLHVFIYIELWADYNLTNKQ